MLFVSIGDFNAPPATFWMKIIRLIWDPSLSEFGFETKNIALSDFAPVNVLKINFASNANDQISWKLNQKIEKWFGPETYCLETINWFPRGVENESCRVTLAQNATVPKYFHVYHFCWVYRTWKYDLKKVVLAQDPTKFWGCHSILTNTGFTETSSNAPPTQAIILNKYAMQGIFLIRFSWKSSVSDPDRSKSVLSNPDNRLLVHAEFWYTFLRI